MSEALSNLRLSRDSGLVQRIGSAPPGRHGVRLRDRMRLGLAAPRDAAHGRVLVNGAVGKAADVCVRHGQWRVVARRYTEIDWFDVGARYVNPFEAVYRAQARRRNRADAMVPFDRNRQRPTHLWSGSSRALPCLC